MNRVASSSFPNTVAGVLNQPGQFYPASSGTLQKTIEAGINDTCYSAARDAMNGVQPVPGALYFNTSSGTTKLGDHYFS
jgi:spore germination cell wall hydrolase CwlJ-like protein